MMQRDLACLEPPGLDGELFKGRVRCLVQALAANFQVQNLSVVTLSLLWGKKTPNNKLKHFWVVFLATCEQSAEGSWPPPCLVWGSAVCRASGLGCSHAPQQPGGWRGAARGGGRAAHAPLPPPAP